MGPADYAAGLENITHYLGVKGPVARVMEDEYGGYGRTGEVHFLLGLGCHGCGCKIVIKKVGVPWCFHAPLAKEYGMARH
jgi:hypothetical protein